jgi:ribosomal protein L11 methyltransferase
VKTRDSSTDSATFSAELIRLGMVVPADRSEMAVAAACALLGVGCREERAGEGRTRIVFWVPPVRAEIAASGLAVLAERVGGRVDPPVVEDPAWRTAMREFHQPVVVAGRIRVRPPWHPPADGVIDVVVDPAMAFGTGQHDTTRGCLELLLELEPGRVIDIGCGSGVLAIAAVRLGHRPVWAWDLDPLAVDATITNARTNGVALNVGRRDALRDPLPEADVLLGNLTANVLTALAPRLFGAPLRAAILSGMRPGEIDEVGAAWALGGFGEVGRRVGENWGTVLLRRP